MKYSALVIPTLRDPPADAEIASHILLTRAGFIRRQAVGSYHWLPLGVRVLEKVQRIVRAELARAGAQEVLMPVVQPAELWRRSGRWDAMGPELLRFADRQNHDYCLSPTQEEAVTELFGRIIASYKQLPCNLYHIQTKYRDEIRPRFGLMRAREFIMKDGYSFHLDKSSMDATYAAMHACYSAILERIGLRYCVVEADSGAMGGSDSHEFHVLAAAGEDRLAYSPASDYVANVEKADAPAIADDAQPGELAKTSTPGRKTIEDVAAFLGVPHHRCIKTLIVRAHADGDEPAFVALVLRGDHQLNEAKAMRLDRVSRPLEFATEDEVQAALGVGVGSIGPIGLPLPLIVDRSAAALASFVCGANEDDCHFVGGNWQRDVRDVGTDMQIADIRNVVEGDPAADGSGPLAFMRGIEVGHIFKLGTKYTEAMHVAVQDDTGRDIAPIMGCYGFGVSRIVAAVVEQCHDDDGIVWPEAVAPFAVHIVALNNSKSAAVQSAAAALHRQLEDAGVEVLFDDRDERPGVKFADADLIGIPHRITIGERGLQAGIVEYRRRNAPTVDKLSPSAVVGKITNR